ncbi:MAG TPA: outer membrane lipoprotein carrier protein LolA [Propionibacteriaceae bacterium]|jgi:outer membrane lipoprotein-sorting protein|nr:outer membrane lipoprotein carrier protein LolA [Propionibacteriaceae bacterium]
MRIFDSKPAMRLLAPLAFILVVAGTGFVAATASAEKRLPTRTPQELLVDLQQARTDGLSGTVVERADLGIPAIPGADGRDNAELTSLISGTHTLRVRYSAPDKARLAVLGTYSEYDLIRNGKDVWTWSSKDNAATHRTVTAEPGSTPSETPKTPEEAANRVLKALEPTTTVTTDSSVEVAGRPAYELVLDPNDSNSLISQVRIAIDGDAKLPLRVQVFGTDNKIVFEVAYTSVDFTRPDDAEFVFNPPPGAKVTEVQPSDKTPSAQDRKQSQDARKATTVVGSGWTAVAVTKVGDLSNSQSDQQLKAFLSKLQPVQGSWGSGRLLAGTAFSAVWTDDGRLAVGAVRPDVIYQALNR